MLLSTLIATIGLASSVRAWGGLGHKTVANVALQFMPEIAIARVNEILANDPSNTLDNPTIVDVALWADHFSGTPGGLFSKQYHYIAAHDNPPTQCNVDLGRDCSGAGECIVKAIANYTGRLLFPDPNETPQNTANYLKFLVHFVADVTQPLHADAVKTGGTEIMVQWDGVETKLHSVWDNNIITKLAGSNDAEHVQAWTGTILDEIEYGIYQNLFGQWQLGTNAGDALNCATEWARDTNALMCGPAVLYNPTGKDLSLDYYDTAAPFVQEQIAKAGVRLGVLLGQLFGPDDARELPLATERITVQHRDL